MNLRILALLAALFVIAGLATSPADARGRDGGESAIFHDITIPAGAVIDGDVNDVFGNVKVAGIVTGDCNAVFGTCMTVEDGQVRGTINGVGNEGVRAFVPWVVGGHGTSVFGDQDRQLFTQLLSSAVILLVFLLFPLRMRIALDRVEKHPGLAALSGLVGAVATIPIAILLLVSIIGIPLLLLEAAAVVCGVWLGTGAIALLVGRRLCELVMPTSTPSPLVALILGLVVVSAAEILPVVGILVTVLLWLVGFGAAILSFVRSTQVDATVRRTSIGGPPMQNWR